MIALATVTRLPAAAQININPVVLTEEQIKRLVAGTTLAGKTPDIPIRIYFDSEGTFTLAVKKNVSTQVLTGAWYIEPEADLLCLSIATGDGGRQCWIVRRGDTIELVSSSGSLAPLDLPLGVIRFTLQEAGLKLEFTELSPSVPPTPPSNPYSSKDQAASLSVSGVPVTYTLPASANDYWGRFSVTERTKVSAGLDWSDSSIDLDMALVGESGGKLGESTGSNTTEKIESIVPPGSYLVHVYRYKGTGSAPFHLTLSRIALPPPPPAVTWIRYENWDLEGGDFSDLPFGQKGIDERACFQECQGRSGCIGYSYNKWTKACYPKRSVDFSTYLRKDAALRTILRTDVRLPDVSSKPARIHRTSRELFGSELRRERRANRAQCEANCESDDSCWGTTFTSPNICVLYAQIDSVIDNAGYWSGQKEQEPGR